ncbi:phosphoglycerate mutase family protein [Grosmannia clavigera kw1407]|uniref:Phosphoglycerate mutase family protein n=1 Tax=Grosmannia clavigera (strain kw1407 / UAMH 11150) TaxID=655863 RepID=F0XBP8_GROCL|nr:phosphoglycerate mutase family protein [Grosmannia clavigera kw1407]EFX04883.1 phosphoglycerate mutase family protein [Grosmannia clavigera kw1407]
MTTPRVFIIRHGETEWSLSGRHTGVTDIPLTANGERRIMATGRAMVGKDRLIVPKKLAHIYVSPRRRAQRTFELLHLDLPEPLPWQCHGSSDGRTSPPHLCNARVEIAPDVREWDYGDYEGITSPEIRAKRVAQGIPGRWDIWRDGCPGGESPAEITDRLDALIADLRERFHKPALEAMVKAKTTGTKAAKDASASLAGDVLIVAHGHILRALAMRWVGAALQDGPTFLLEAGGIGTLSYEHNNIEEPAILLGGAFTVDLDTDGEENQALAMALARISVGRVNLGSSGGDVTEWNGGGEKAEWTDSEI